MLELDADEVPALNISSGWTIYPPKGKNVAITKRIGQVMNTKSEKAFRCRFPSMPVFHSNPHSSDIEPFTEGGPELYPLEGQWVEPISLHVL